ncbi:hypothetical protein U3516DRAFT_770032 [Neocallimastix sp. 'constans']
MAMTDEIGEKLKNLFLQDNNLSGSIPESIGNLTELKELKLHKNNITGPIPNSIGKLTILEILYLNDNNLSGELPTKEMKKMHGLQDIDTHICYPKEKVNSSCHYPKTYYDYNIYGIGYIECKQKSGDGHGKRRKSNSDIISSSSRKNVKEINVVNNPQINSIDKIPDTIFGIPVLERIFLSEKGKIREYYRNEIVEIREKRINKINDEIRKILNEVRFGNKYERRSKSIHERTFSEKFDRYVEIYEIGEKFPL